MVYEILIDYDGYGNGASVAKSKLLAKRESSQLRNLSWFTRKRARLR